MNPNRGEAQGPGIAGSSELSATDAQGSELSNAGQGRESGHVEAVRYGAASVGLGITTAFSRFLARIRYEDLSPAAAHEAKRAVLDWIGCAIAGSDHATANILIATFQDIGSVPTVTVLGRGGLKLGLLDGAVVNGQMGHVHDFDDTHLGGVILHTSTAALPALLALGEWRESSGRDIIVALVAAFEAGVRVGQAAPCHHQGGWHLTGTLGTVAAAAGSARLLGLNESQTAFALGIACTQAAGMQQNRGSDCKSLHAGKAGYHGVLAALLASRGFTSSPEILEGSLGFTKIFSSTQNNGAITADLGKTWMITGNGYKPYACGVVLHPLIDATIDVSQKSRVPPTQVALIETLVHPDVIRITGVDQPGSGLMSKFSANHAAAVAYIDQAAGVAQFSNERAQDPNVLALRKVIQVKPVLTYRLDQASAIVVANSGATFETEIAHATGTVSNPLSDHALRQKFFANATPKLGADRAQEVVDMVSKLDTIENVGELIRICM